MRLPRSGQASESMGSLDAQGWFFVIFTHSYDSHLHFREDLLFTLSKGICVPNLANENK